MMAERRKCVLRKKHVFSSKTLINYFINIRYLRNILRWFRIKSIVERVREMLNASNPLVFEYRFPRKIFSLWRFFSAVAATNKNNRPNNRSDLNKFSLFNGNNNKKTTKKQNERSWNFFFLSTHYTHLHRNVLYSYRKIEMHCTQNNFHHLCDMHIAWWIVKWSLRPVRVSMKSAL